MAVTSGSCYSSYARNTRFRIDWEKTGTWNDSSGCGSIIKWKLVLENGNQWYSNAIKCYAIYINGSKVHDGGTWSNYTSSGNYDLIGWQTGVRIAHNNAGNEKTFNINYTGWFYSSYNVSASTDFTLPSIPRGTSISSFTVSKRNETSMQFNWATADNVDALYYSTNNGSSWTNASISGTNYGNFYVSNLSPSTTYNCKIKVVRNTIETISSAVSQTTNAVPTQSLKSKTETSITMNWSCDDTASSIQYSLNNGAWQDAGSVNAKSGSYTISGLSANTTYTIKTNVKRKGPQTWYSTTASSQTTYNYPSVSAVGTSALTIGNSQTLTLYNPLSRSVTVKMYQTSTSGTQLYSGTTSGTSITFTPTANTLYASIPNATSSKCVYSVIYSSSTKTTTGNYTYQVNTSSCIPTFSNFAYKDTATSELITTIANNQTIVQNVSNVNLVISSANKMVAKNSATASKYSATFSNLSKTNIAYSSSDIDTNIGTPTGSGNQTFKVTAYDSRNISKEVSKTINIIPYTAPVVNASLTRLNGFENETHLKVTGTFSRVTISNSDKNLIKSVQYRYKESTASSWGSWTTMTISSQGTGSYQTSELTLSFDNSKQYDFQMRTTDRAKTTTVSKTLSIGQPLMFLNTSGDLDISGKTTTNGLTSSGQVIIKGSAASIPFKVRGITGCSSDGSSADNLYVQYGTNKPVLFGNTGAYSISADGSQYTGNSATATTATTATTASECTGNSATATRATNSTYSDIVETNPTSATGYYGTFVTGLGENKSLRGNDGFRYRCINGTTSAEGSAILQMGNETASGTAGNKRGYLRLFDKTTYYGALQTNGSFTGNRSLTMPNHNGTIQVRPTNLYTNSSGTSGTVTLSETATNYSYLEIFYGKGNDYKHSVRVFTGHDMTNITLIAGKRNTSTFVQIGVVTIKISGTSITHVANGGANITNAVVPEVYTTNEMNIFRVDGWR